jgi:putative endonuclease
MGVNAMYYIYMLRSVATGRHYYGYTNDLEDRLYRHQNNGSPSTKNRGPWVLIGYLTTPTKSEAIQIEKRMKNFRNPERALNYLRQNGQIAELPNTMHDR